MRSNFGVMGDFAEATGGHALRWSGDCCSSVGASPRRLPLDPLATGSAAPATPPESFGYVSDNSGRVQLLTRSASWLPATFHGEPAPAPGLSAIHHPAMPLPMHETPRYRSTPT